MPACDDAGDNRFRLAMGFVLDVVGFGRRPARAQEDIQLRLRSLVRSALNDIGIAFEETCHDTGSGDSIAVFLPVHTDPTRALPGLLAAMAKRLAGDNERYSDRMRIRMALDVGLVGPGPLGVLGGLIVDLSRLNDSAPIRDAVRDHPGSDLVALVSNGLHKLVIRSGHLPAHQVPLTPVDVTLNEFSAPAWLWISPALPTCRT